ncbi:MAG TPA: hypothetical protein VG621_01645 [Candidatus Paceibacterota bacterium]|nr:hypothetical protein [Candidatus Paceibacterota bacterium]
MDSENNIEVTPPNTSSAHDQHTLMGILAYLGPLVIIPYATMKDDSFIKFHIKQGLVLLVLEVILWILSHIFFWYLWGLVSLINLALLILAIIGIVNVVQKKEKELPVVGSFAKHFTF